MTGRNSPGAVCMQTHVPLLRIHARGKVGPVGFPEAYKRAQAGGVCSIGEEKPREMPGLWWAGLEDRESV